MAIAPDPRGGKASRAQNTPAGIRRTFPQEEVPIGGRLPPRDLSPYHRVGFPTASVMQEAKPRLPRAAIDARARYSPLLDSWRAVGQSDAVRALSPSNLDDRVGFLMALVT